MHGYSRGVVLGLLCLSIFTSCAVRSISNPGRPSPWDSSNQLYRGELNEIDILGEPSSGNRIVTPVRLRPQQRVLVIQSGALFPDQPVLTGFGEHFDVGVLSGIPTDYAAPEFGVRGIAARGGYDAVLCYWGVLETRERPTAGKAAAWVPVVGFFVPDESQQMRIRLKVVVLDVATGNWTGLLPQPIDDERASSLFTRESSDRDQVDLLKRAAYRVMVDHVASELMQR